MTAIIAAVAMLVVVLFVLLAVSGDEDEVEVGVADPVREFLDAVRTDSADVTSRRRRVLALGQRTARDIAVRMRTGSGIDEPETRAAVELVVEDLGLVGLRELAHELRSVERSHAALPALVRRATVMGSGGWSAVAACGADAQCLVVAALADRLAERVARTPELALTAAGALRAAGRPVPEALLPAAACLPGSARLPSAESTPVPEVVDGAEPADIGSPQWVTWAFSRVGDVRIREALCRVASGAGPSAFEAVAAVACYEPGLAASLLRDRRRDPWGGTQPAWLRLAVEAGGEALEPVAVDMVASLPSVSAVGSAFASLRPERMLDRWLDVFARATPAGRTFVDAAMRSNRDGVRGAIVASIGRDSPRTRAAVELAGRLGLEEALPALAAFGTECDVCRARATWSAELIGAVVPDDIVRDAPFLKATNTLLVALGAGSSRAADGTAADRAG